MTRQQTKSRGLNRSVKDLPNLDLLRTCAVLFVVTSHVMTQFRWPIPPNIEWLGITGVFIFFTHTCLVLMWSLQRKPHPLDFYIRRAFRIYPAAMVIILITVLFQIPALNYGPATGFQYVHASVWNVIENLLLVQNLRGPLIVGVTWSLPLEMQMYIVLPFLFFFVIRNRAIWPLLLLWALSVVTVLAVLERPKVLSLPFCIPYFLPGVMAYVGYTRWTPRLPSWTFLLDCFCLQAGSCTIPVTTGPGFFVSSSA